ncbi:MAG: trimethylamine methyltransferase family protein [Desulfobacterales bacterium]|nr:trimethylamine methyltransferase family protein [Desulfobacterales bacterium]
MESLLKVLSNKELDKVHERSLEILSRTGVKVDTFKGREFLKKAGADVDENTHMVRYPRDLVEESIRLAPKEFGLGARRPDSVLQMNGGDCKLVLDGEATMTLDRKTGERRTATMQDWLEATIIGDALDEVGVYWTMVDAADRGTTIGDYVSYLRLLFRNFSKHIQDVIYSPKQAPWLLEVMQTVFGDKDTIRKTHPFSFLLCPESPLFIDGPYTDAYLELTGWDIPVAIETLPLMGATAPASLISTIIQGNCEVLSILCLLQAASPGTPVIYAGEFSVMNPRTGKYGSGAIENSILGAAATEMGRYYNLPVQATGFTTDQHMPGIQSSYERSLNIMMPVLAWPDLLVGPGLLGGSMILSLEQLIIDAEIFRMNVRAHRGIVTEEDKWLDDVIDKVGPNGNFLTEMSTVKAVRDGEWYMSSFGLHDSYETWEAAGKKSMMEEAGEKVEDILKNHRPLTLGEDVEKELEKICKRAKKYK